MAERRTKEKRTGTKTPGRKPQPPEPGPRDTDQVNFTDPESPDHADQWQRLAAGLERADWPSIWTRHLIVGGHISQAPNDKQELEPVLNQLEACPSRWAIPNALPLTTDIIVKTISAKPPTGI
ncbi:MAG: hypothetical protein U5K69_30225 [Balneolaceae bacterium]|nr:hypothetical protein [Balneolaceae bacterium]